MLPTKFQVNWPFGSGEKAKNRFSRCHHSSHLGFPIGTILAFLKFTSHPDASYQVSSQLVQGCRRRRLLKQIVDAAQWTMHSTPITIAHLEHFVLRWAKKNIILNTPLTWSYAKWCQFYCNWLNLNRWRFFLQTFIKQMKCMEF